MAGIGKKPTLVAGLLLFLCFPLPVWADTLLLKNGDRVDGRFLSVDERGYVFETNGAVRTIPLSDVAKLLIDQTKSPGEEVKPKRTAPWMNFVLPGWNQVAEGRTGVGLTIGGVFLTSAFLSVHSGSEANRFTREYEDRSRQATFLAFATPSPLHLAVIALTYSDVANRRHRVERARESGLFWLGVSALAYGAGIAEYRFRGGSAAVFAGPGTLSFAVSF